MLVQIIRVFGIVVESRRRTIICGSIVPQQKNACPLSCVLVVSAVFIRWLVPLCDFESNYLLLATHFRWHISIYRYLFVVIRCDDMLAAGMLLQLTKPWTPSDLLTWSITAGHSGAHSSFASGALRIIYLYCVVWCVFTCAILNFTHCRVGWLELCIKGARINHIETQLHI